MNPRQTIFLALDGLPINGIVDLVRSIVDSDHRSALAGVKIHDLWDQQGPCVVAELEKLGVSEVWVDLKLHDTPRTVGYRAVAVNESGANLLTVHAAGGMEMMRQAVQHGPAIIAITVLTSLSEEEVYLLTGHPVKAMVLQRAMMAKLAGAAGIVCSPHEVGMLTKQPEFKGLDFFVPGIRLGGADATDSNQARVNTPAAALLAGGTHIVVGSEVTKADDPVEAFARIVENITSASKEE